MYQEPNPMDPWDPVKRWYRSLWPVERCAVWITAAVLVYAAFRWVTI